MVHPLLVKLREAVTAGGYTAEQLRNATHAQIAAVLEVDSDRLKTALAANLRAMVADELQVQEDAAMLTALRSRVLAAYPDAVFERLRVGGKLRLTIWPQGKPEVQAAQEGGGQ